MISHPEKPSTAEELQNILHPLVKRWFFSRFPSFSLPQLFGVMEIHKRQNILISAPTGATKTLTGFLAILNELIDSSEKGILEDKVYCVYISPLKALNEDIKVNLVTPLRQMEEIAGKKLDIRVAVRTGDTTQSEKAAMLKHPPHILITTPESLGIMLSSAKFVDYLKDVQWCIVDEIHALAENKRGVQLSLSIEWLQKLSPAMTRVGLSATVAPLDEIAAFLVGYMGEAGGARGTGGTLRDCQVVDVQFLKQMDVEVVCPVDDLVTVDYMLKHRAMYQLMHELIQQHKTTLIFTNTRSATERVAHTLKEIFPQSYNENIAAHHGSLGKGLRHSTEERLRKGELKVVVSSTSLELGIDIGFIDLVLCLGSPKSVARFLQRVGRAGHQLHSTVKGRIIVMDRDDLVECSVLLKCALERKIDRVHIPTGALDVLSQAIVGFAVQEKMIAHELFALVKQSYCYHGLAWGDFEELLRYLAGEYAALEDRHVYAKIWYDKETGMVGRRGKMARVIYMTNIGTIPEETFVTVKIGEQVVGHIDEGFLERMKPGDIFVLGGEVYRFKFSRGMTAQVSASTSRPPTVPSWFSEMLPLSFDLAMEIGRFRRMMQEKFKTGLSKEEILHFILTFLGVDGHTAVDGKAAENIYNYFFEQYHFSKIPTDKKIVIEHFKEKEVHYAVFHTLFGRRVNDCLSRAVAFAIGRIQHKDVEIGINDNGFYVGFTSGVQVLQALKALQLKNLRQILEQAIEKSEVLHRRFRHCACRALMILREYKGHHKQVGRQHMSSRLLFYAVKRLNEHFPILKEARREVLEDVMDFENTRKVLEWIEKGEVKVEEQYLALPSPFAFNLVMQGYGDVLKMEERHEFLKRMHKEIMKIVNEKNK